MYVKKSHKKDIDPSSFPVLCIIKLTELLDWVYSWAWGLEIG